MSTFSLLTDIKALLTSGSGGSDVAGVVAANGKLDQILSDLGITGTTPGTIAVSSISPTTGPITGQTNITITGSGFVTNNATGVNVGTVAATANFKVVNDTTITVDTPAQAAGAFDVVVTSAAGNSAATPADVFTYA